MGRGWQAEDIGAYLLGGGRIFQRAGGGAQQQLAVRVAGTND